MEERSRAEAALFLVLVAGCTAEPAATDTEDPVARGQRVETEAVSPRAFVDRVNVNATVLTDDDVTLSAETGGTVELAPRLGMNVQAGEIVVRLDDDIAQAAVGRARAALAMAEAGLAVAKARFDRQQPLFEREVISALEFEGLEAERAQAGAQVAQAQASLRESLEQLELSRVRAPFAGTVEERMVEVGEQVAPGTPLVRVVGTDEVRVRGAIPERYASDIVQGTKARVLFSAYGVEPREGQVGFVGRAIDPASRTFTVELTLDNPGGVLKPQMVGRLLVDRAVVEDAISVPQTAILTDDEGQSVFVVQRDGALATADRRRVEVGVRSGGRVVVTSGLEKGDEVIVVGQQSLARGDLVEPSAKDAQ